MLVPQQSDLIFASTLELLEKQGSRDKFRNQIQDVPIYGSFVVGHQIPQNDPAQSLDRNVEFNQVIVLNTSEQWTARLATSEFLHHKAAIYEFIPIVTMRLRSKTYLTVGLKCGNIRQAYFQLSTQIPSTNKLIGVNYKFTSLRSRPTFISMGFWISTLDGLGVIELKSSVKSEATMTLKRPITKYLNSYLKVNWSKNSYKPTIQAGLDYQMTNLKLQAYTQNQKTVMNLCVNAIFKINDAWKTNLQANFQEEKMYLNIGQILTNINSIQNKTFYFQFPILCSKIAQISDKFALVFIGGLAIMAIHKLNSLRQLQKIENLVEVKLNNPEERLKNQKNVLALMQQRIQENYKYEEECQGLIIIEAYYGKDQHIQELMRQQFKAQYHLNNNLQIVDVTLSLVFWTKQSELHLFAKSKKDLIGFCDPCVEESKKLLYVKYKFRNVEHETMVQDNEELRLP